MSTVVDASLVVDLLTSPDRRPELEPLVADRHLIAPGHLDAEVLSAAARQVRAGQLTEDEVDILLHRLVRLPIQRVPITGPMLSIAWSLRHNIAAHDALYVALMQMLGADLVTSDQRLARAVEQLE